MKIIDKDTGERLKTAKKTDPIKANPEKEASITEAELSPMDPPDAYSEFAQLKDTGNSNTRALNVLVNEHKEVNEVLHGFEKSFFHYPHVLQCDV